ncbi:MAG: hypothetical protein B7Z23_13535 [Pseudomonadales bacterium 32-61-5]|nr:MAG: hypothetical protein B7Z23_13535 [Pseudomonadales bacterium 32-61-5]
MSGSFNLACLTMAERHLIEADKTACLIRWKCKGLTGAERQRKGQELMAAVPESARPAVVERLKARAGR